MQLFVGTDCAIAMKKPNNTKSCSYCSAREGGRQGGREGGASRGLSRRRRRRGLKKKAKNYAKTGPTFAVATANTETKECAQKQTVAAAAPCSVLCCLPPTPLKNGRKKNLYLCAPLSFGNFTRRSLVAARKNCVLRNPSKFIIVSLVLFAGVFVLFCVFCKGF